MNTTLLRIYSCAKINPALSVRGKRADGYHEIQTVFQTIDLCDEIEIRPSERLELQCQGLPGVPREENLVWKAASRLCAAAGGNKGAAIKLKKKIPVGAGLGGGSSNAAAVLLGLKRFWQLDDTNIDLAALAADLGSDVPFFLTGGMALGTGRGEKVTPLPDSFTEHLVVIFPGIHISTAEAYRSLNLGLTSAQEDSRILKFCGRVKEGKRWISEIFNDFESVILPAYPRITEAMDFLKDRGAVATLLSGSGSAVFGFFSDEESALAISREKPQDAWQAFPAKTLSRSEYFQKMLG